MKKQYLIAAILISATGYAHAQSDVFVCVNSSGAKEYKNVGTTKGCKRVDLQGISMIPSNKPVMQLASARTTSTPSDFPRIDGSTQKARDNDRMTILQEEMKTEEKKLVTLKKEFNNGEPDTQGQEKTSPKYQERVASLKADVSRTEKNIEALKREIGNLK